jgi:hypothetical protein
MIVYTANTRTIDRFERCRPVPVLPASPVLKDHQPYVALPEARALDNQATDMFNRGDIAGVLPLRKQVLVMAQTTHATNATPQTILDVVFTAIGRYETGTR